MPEMKTLNGYEVVDAKAREDIKELQNAGHATEEYVDEAIAAIPKPDYTGLATEAYVDNAIDNIPEVDLSKHALKSELPTKVSQLQNDSKFITREEVPETDLSAYAKKSEIPDVSDFITSIPSEYITESELNAKGYLTQHQDISGKADKNHTHPEYLTEHQSLANYATKKYVDDAIADIEIPEDADLSGYAKKTDIPTKVSQLTNDSNYLTSIPGEYVTESELNAKGYLTQHQSLADYAKKSELFSGSYNDLTDKPTIPSTDGLASTQYVDEAIANIDIPDAGGIVAYTFNGDESRNVITDEERAVVEAVYKSIANGTGEHEDYLLYVHTSKGVFPVISVEYDASAINSHLKFIYNHDFGNGSVFWTYIGFNIDTSTGTCSYRTCGSEAVNTKNWTWSTTYSSINVPVGTYRHVRIVGYYGTDSSNVATFDMSCPYNSKFMNSTSNPYFVFPDVFKASQDGLLKWRFESNVFKLYVDGEVDTNFKCTGVWMQVE